MQDTTEANMTNIRTRRFGLTIAAILIAAIAMLIAPTPHTGVSANGYDTSPGSVQGPRGI